MDAPYPAPLTSVQLAAVNAGEGHACFIDPATSVVYHVVSQGDPPSISEDYIRAKLAAAQADVDRGDVAEWNADEVKELLRRRLTGNSPQ